MTKAIIHIGAAKCASSYIRSKILSEAENIKYYERGGEVCELVKKYCVGKVDVRPCWGESENGKIVISHEGLSIQKGKKGKLANRLGEIFDNAKIIYVIREQRDWLSSRYSQDLKNYMGIKTDYYSFEEWLEEKFHEDMSQNKDTSIYYKPIERVKYDEIYKSYRNVFGEVEIITYEKLKNRKKEFISDIQKQIGERFRVEDRNYEEVVNKRKSKYEEKIQKKMSNIRGHKRISSFMSKFLPYEKADRRELVPEKYKNIFRSTNEELRSMGIQLTSEYL